MRLLDGDALDNFSAELASEVEEALFLLDLVDAVGSVSLDDRLHAREPEQLLTRLFERLLGFLAQLSDHVAQRAVIVGLHELLEVRLSRILGVLIA